MTFNDSGDSLAIAEDGTGVTLVSVADMRVSGSLSHEAISHVQIRGERALTVSQTQSARWWDLSSGSQLGEFSTPNVRLLSGAIAPSGALVATGDENGSVTVWNTGDFKPVRTRQHGDPVRGLAFSPDGQWLASGGDDFQVRLWRVEKGIQVAALRHAQAHVWDVAFDPTGTELQSTSNDGLTRRWVVAIELPPAPAYLADDAREQPKTSWIDDDVDALARLVASRQMPPPLSVAVFGDWGSGKTFFMRRLKSRIERLSHQAGRSGLMQREVGYYKHIAQVEFNAWHYSNADLWASLVDNLFTQLSLAGADKNKSRERIRELFKDAIKQDRADLRSASMVVGLLKQEHETAEKSVDDIRERQSEHNARLKEVQKQERSVAKQFIDRLTREQEPAIAALSDAGYANLGDTPQQVLESIRAARKVADEADKWFAFFHTRSRLERIGWLLLVVALPRVVGVVLYFAAPLFPALAGLGWLAAAAGSLFARASEQTKWLTEFRDGILSAQHKAEDELLPAQGKLEREKEAAEQRLKDVTAELTEAQDRRAALQRRLRTREAEIQSGDPAALFSRLVGDRTESDYYRKYLGLVSLVRRDFEAISNFVEEDRKRLEDPNWLRQQERDSDKSRINRVVLYIDDLDRCPPEVVVNVLEAIHLLLSFPFFVVVVGVDVRWVSRALALRYPDLLPDKKGRVPAASPMDYLEKIFQIPFWVEPLETVRVRQLLGQLVGTDTTSLTRRVDRVARNGAEAPPQQEAPADEQTGETSGDVQAEVAVADAPPMEDLSARTLELSDLEHDALNEIAPVLVRSPRAIKRFINIYRLIRTREYREGFVEEGGTASDARVLMFLLALVTSRPDGANALFELLARDRPPAPRRLKELVDAVASRNPELRTVSAWLGLPENQAWAQVSEDALQRWWPQASRFSFRPRQALS
jgi:KAP family P-loop domain/WD domain, G-beta repeat